MRCPSGGRNLDSPYLHIPIKYGAKEQFTKAEDDSPLLDKESGNFIQRVNDIFLYLRRAVNLTFLTVLSAVAARQAKSTEETMKSVRRQS